MPSQTRKHVLLSSHQPISCAQSTVLYSAHTLESDGVGLQTDTAYSIDQLSLEDLLELRLRVRVEVGTALNAVETLLLETDNRLNAYVQLPLKVRVLRADYWRFH